MILVDTSVLIDFFNSSENLKTQLFKDILINGNTFGITSQIFQEVLQGSRTEKDYKKLKTYLETQIFYVPKDPIESFAKAAQIYKLCRKKGFSIRNTIDCLISQIAMEQNLYLLHNDKDFDHIAKIVELRILK